MFCISFYIRAYPHWQKKCLFRQIFCHRLRLTSAEGLSRLDIFLSKWTNLQTHRRQNLPRVKTGQNRLDNQNSVKFVNHLS